MTEISKFLSKDIGDLSKLFGIVKGNLSKVLKTDVPSGEILEFTVHNMTDYTVPPPFVVSDSSHYPAHNGWKCWNGRLNNVEYWLTNGVIAGWVKIDVGVGNEKILVQYEVQNNALPIELDRAPKDWTIQGSNTDIDWHVLDTVTGEIDWATSEKRLYTCDVALTAYRYFKMSITANNGDPSYSQIGELYFWGRE
jgi:hypothetical protein